jgi:dipeptidyl aminopeptidase/acylaminoacyl peptidase
VAPAGEWRQLHGGRSRWYAFRYAGDGSQIEIRLQAEPEESLDLEVWTPEGVRRWGLGVESGPVGRGSANPYVDGVISWSGSFEIAGTYYVIVRHAWEAGSGPEKSHYRLEVHGDGVSVASQSPPVTSVPELVKPTPESSAPSAPTGKLAIQTTWGGPFYVVNADGTGLRCITDGMDPTWSPDGMSPARIAFVRWREPRGVWIVDANSGDEWRVFDWIEARWPSWSPDGSHLLFSRQHGGRLEEGERCFWGFCFKLPEHPHWKLAVVRLSDGGFREPPASQFSQAPEWSPSGERIVYADEQGLRIQSEDGKVSYLLTHDANDTSPAWSPDGSRVAFTRRQHDHWEVYVVDADGQSLGRLTDTPRKPDGQVGSSVAAAWSPDGHYLAFLTNRGGKWEIWIMQANGHAQRPMFDGILDDLKLDYAYLGERAISWTE